MNVRYIYKRVQISKILRFTQISGWRHRDVTRYGGKLHAGILLVIFSYLLTSFLHLSCCACIIFEVVLYHVNIRMNHYFYLDEKLRYKKLSAEIWHPRSHCTIFTWTRWPVVVSLRLTQVRLSFCSFVSRVLVSSKENFRWLCGGLSCDIVAYCLQIFRIFVKNLWRRTP